MHNLSIFRFFLPGLAAFGCLSGTPVLADESSRVHPFLSSRYSIQLGGFFPTHNVRLRVDGSAGIEGTDIDFDETFDMRRGGRTLAMEFTWRFGKKWSARMQYFNVDQTEKAVLEEDIEWGDEIIEAGSSVTAGTDFELARVFFARSFDSTPNLDYGIGIGIHWLEIGAFIKHDFLTSFGETSSVAASGPLPNIGTWYYYSPSEKWYVGGRLDWFEASVGEYDGGIMNIAVGVNYQMFKNFGVGVKYQDFRFKVDVDKSDWHGEAKLSFAGAFLYLSGSWK